MIDKGVSLSFLTSQQLAESIECFKWSDTLWFWQQSITSPTLQWIDVLSYFFDKIILGEYCNIDSFKISKIENKNKNYVSNNIKKIDFKNLKKNKILYVPTRIVNVSVGGKNYLHKKDYEDWQNFLASKLEGIDAKFPYKKFDYKVNNNFNILDNNLKLLEICCNYDLVILDYISSTTFGEIGGTNVPILYFNLNRDEINKDAKKIVESRVSEIKVDIFNDYKGFEKIYKLKKRNKRKNKFKTTYLESSIKKSLYQNLLDIDKHL